MQDWQGLAIEIVGFTVLVPAGISFAIVLLVPRVARRDAAHRYALALAFAAAFFVGYALLPSWARLAPDRHWQWLPYLAAGGMLTGAVGWSGGILWIERRVLHTALAVVAALLLVPTWPDLEPARPVHVALLAGGLVLLVALLEPLQSRISATGMVWYLGVASAAAAVMLAAFLSVKFGQVCGAAAAAMGGCWVASCWRGGTIPVQGLIPAYVVAVAGAAFVGSIEPKPPMYALLLVPAAPLALWVTALPPVARLRGWTAAVVHSAAVLLPIAVAFILLFQRQFVVPSS